MARKKAAVATGNNELHLKAIEVLSSTLTPPVETKSGDVDYLFDIGIEHRVSESERLVFVVVSVVIRADGLPESLGSLTASCIFRIDNLEEVVIPGPDNGVQLPKKLIASLNNISISTTRGLMFANFKGTFLHNAVLPVVI